MGESDIVGSWSLRIAEEAAPDEVEIAADMARAFIAGGKKKDLFRQSGQVHGGFGVDIALLFPLILSAIEIAGPRLLDFLSTVIQHSGHVASFAGTLSSLVNVSSYFERRKKVESLPDNHYAPLKEVIDKLSEGLHKAGVDQDRANTITLEVLKVMLEDPSEASQFTKKVAQIP